MPDWLLFGGIGAIISAIVNAVLVFLFVFQRKNQDRKFWELEE